MADCMQFTFDGNKSQMMNWIIGFIFFKCFFTFCVINTSTRQVGEIFLIFFY